MYQKMRKSRVWCVAYTQKKGGDAYVLEQVYLFFIYILLSELAIVTVVAIALIVALVVTIRKIDSKKHISAIR